MDKRQRPISLQTTSQGTPGMSTFYDALETRSPAEREAALMAALPQQIAHAQKASPAFAGILAGVDAPTIPGRTALAKLPVTRSTSCWSASRQAAPPTCLAAS